MKQVFSYLLAMLLGISVASCNREADPSPAHTSHSDRNSPVVHMEQGADSGSYPGDQNGTPPETEPPLPLAGELPDVSIGELPSHAVEIPQISSFMLFHDGEIVAEHFRDGVTRNTTVNIKSASKSIMSALIGIAIREGYIDSVDDPVSRYLPGYFQDLEESRKHEITIHHLLTMSSGLASTSFRNYGAWVASSDWVGYVVRGELQREPGVRMRYSTGDTHLLSAVLTEASGVSTRRFAEQYLFGPMNVRIGGWDRDPSGYYFGGNNMAVSSSGLLEFGKLYLNNGTIGERRLIPAEWVETSLSSYFENTSYNYRDHDYGYLWWRNTFAGHDTWFAWGYGGQYLFVIPERNAVAVFTGNPDSRAAGRNNRIYDVMEHAVIPALYHADRAEL